jgi:hypothetical protein
MIARLIVESTASQTVTVHDATNATEHATASIEISTVTDADSGLYTCLAKTRLDTVKVEANLSVLDVPKAPFSPEVVEVS